MLEVMKKAMKQASITSKDIICISISNQREPALIWNKNTGKPLMNAIVWQCQRGEGICETLYVEGFGPKVKNKTGLVLSPYFSAAKAKWIMDNCVENNPDIERVFNFWKCRQLSHVETLRW